MNPPIPNPPRRAEPQPCRDKPVHPAKSKKTPNFNPNQHILPENSGLDDCFSWDAALQQCPMGEPGAACPPHPTRAVSPELLFLPVSRQMVSQLCPDIQTSYSAFRRARRGSGCCVLRERPHAVKSCSILFIVINSLCPWRAQGLQPRFCSSLEASHRHSGRLFHSILTYPIPYFKARGEPFQPAPHCQQPEQGTGDTVVPPGWQPAQLPLTALSHASIPSPCSAANAEENV